MRTLEKGFGRCSLRASSFICLGVLVLYGVIMVLYVFTKIEISDTVFVYIFGCVVPLTALFGYTLYKLYQEESSMLRWALIGLCADVAITILTMFSSIITFFMDLFSLIEQLIFFFVPVIAFKSYSAWILYSYWIEFKPAVSVTA